MTTNSSTKVVKKEKKTMPAPSSEDTISTEESSLPLLMKGDSQPRVFGQEKSSVRAGQSGNEIYEEEMRQIESAEESEHEEIENAKSL
jgi:hypothetical protein